MNKRGDLSVTIFVFVVVALFMATLFSFFQNTGNVRVIVGDTGFLDNVYFKENEIKFFIKIAGEEALAESYEKVIGSQEFNESLFDDGKINEISEMASVLFKGSIGESEFDDIHFNKFKEQVSNDEFSLIYDDGREVFLFILRDFAVIGDLVSEKKKKKWVWRETPVNYEDEGVIFGVIYRTDLEVEFYLERFL